MATEPYRIVGVSRMADNDKAVLVSLDRPISDDELRDLHTVLAPTNQDRFGLTLAPDYRVDLQWYRTGTTVLTIRKNR